MNRVKAPEDRPNIFGRADPLPDQGWSRRGAAFRRRSSETGDQTTRDIHKLMIELMPRLRRFAFSLARDWDMSEDLLQETCVRALTHLDQWQPGTRLDSWMFRIAQNVWFDHIRAERVRGQIVDIESVGDLYGCDGRTLMESRLTLHEVTTNIAQLPTDQQVLIHLVCMDGLSYKEAADAVETPVGTVMSRLARARSTLHDLIHRQCGARQ